MKGALHMTPEQVKAYYNRTLGFVPVDALGHIATSLRREVIVEPPAPKKASGKLRKARLPNRTEAEFGRMLEARRQKGEFTRVEFESVRLKVGDGCWYTPDWFCDRLFERPLVIEVKGRHKWDDAIVKYKTAKERYSWADFEMWEKTSDGWRLIG